MKKFIKLTVLLALGLFFTGCSVKNIDNSKHEINKNFSKVYYYTKKSSGDRILIKSYLKIVKNNIIVENKNTSDYLSSYNREKNTLEISNLDLITDEVKQCIFKNAKLIDYKNYFIGNKKSEGNNLKNDFKENKVIYSYCSDLIKLFAEQIKEED